jgi:hypothetical protein
MAKNSAASAVPDMSGYTSSRMKKGVRYLDGQQKASLIARMRKAFAKIRQLEPHH